MSKSKSRPEPPEICPVCGEEVPRNALACPECGADRNSGWRLEAESEDALGQVAGDFDYDEFVRNEFGGGSMKPSGIKPIWWITALVVAVATVLMYLLG